MKRNRKWMLAGAALVIAGSGALADYAMPGGPRHDPFGPMGRICEAKDPMGQRLIDHLQRTVKPTDAQKPELDALKAALTKAQDTM